MKLMMTHIFAESFVLTFLAEWGDRSQISTIILAARDVSFDDEVSDFAAVFWCTLFVTLITRNFQVFYVLVELGD